MMRCSVLALTLGLMTACGCRNDNSPPPPNVPVPSANNPDARRTNPPPKPLPEQTDTSGPRPFYDPPLLIDSPPETKPFVAAYQRVGRPKIALFVNRTLEGQIIPTNPPLPIVRVEETRKTDGPVTVERRDTTDSDSRWRTDRREQTDRFDSKGPGEYRETTEVYLKPGQYDEVAAKSIDYEMMENLMTDWLSADNQITIISPTMARQRLTDEQVKELQSGRPTVLAEVAKQLGCDVLVQAQARPTRQTQAGLEVRVIVDAFNIKGGQSIARAAVDVPPPLDKPQLNRYTRFLARKLMDGMTQAWSAPMPADGPPPQPKEPAVNPTAPRPPAPQPNPLAPKAPEPGLVPQPAPTPVKPVPPVAPAPVPPPATVSPPTTVPTMMP